MFFGADMWPAPRWTQDGEGSSTNPLHQDSKANEIEEDLRIQTALPSLGSALQALGIPLEDYSYFSELLTKPEAIVESPGAQDWDSIFKGLSNVKSVEAPNPSHPCNLKIALPHLPLWLNLTLHLHNRKPVLKRISHIRSSLRTSLPTLCRFLRLVTHPNSSVCIVQLLLWQPRP